MARLDQDDFSNISWQSQPAPAQEDDSLQTQTAPTSEIAPQAVSLDPASDVHQRNYDEAPAGEILECTVGEPHKENDSTKDAYVSYLITTNSTFSSFQKAATTVRRRFTDFVFLYKSLCKDYQAAAVPPLPDKQRMEYVRGDRFGSDFMMRRAHSLERFLARLALHPLLRKDALLHTFLESPDWNATMRARASRSGISTSSPVDNVGGNNGASSGVFDTLTDSFINAFTKVHRPDRRFVEVKDRADKLDEDLSLVEKVMVRVARREADLEADMRDLAEQFQRLMILEPGVEAAATVYAASVEDTAQGLKRLKDATEADYIGSLRDMAAYSGALKALLRAREQKQLDFEQLTEYLNKSSADRDSLATGGTGTSGPVTGGLGFVRSKIEDVRGVDHEQSRRDRQRKLELRIDELTREVESARAEADRFDDAVVKEVGNFEWIKRVEFKKQLGGLADAHIEFHGGVIEVWQRFVQEMEREGAVQAT